jgi:hypothetical protein
MRKRGGGEEIKTETDCKENKSIDKGIKRMKQRQIEKEKERDKIKESHRQRL